MLRTKHDLEVAKNKVKQMGVGYYHLKEGEHIVREYKKPDGSLEKIISGTIKEIIVEFNGNDRQFVKRIKISGYDEEFSVKKFKRFYSPINFDKE